MKKSFLISIHSVTGLVAGLFILLLSVSGSLLVFHDEIDGLQKPAVVSNDHAFISINSCYTAIKQHWPNAAINSCQLPGSGLPFSFFIYDTAFNNGKTAQEIFIHPYAGTILGSRGGSDDWQHNFMGWLSKFHNSFHAGKKGEWLLGCMAFFFVLSLLTGTVIYRKSIGAVIGFKKEVFRRNNLHQLAGVYTLLFNLLIGVTGFWMQRYVFEKDFYSAAAWTNTISPTPALPFNYDSAYTQIKKQYPVFTAYVIYFAQSNTGKTAVYGSNATNGFIHSRKFADVIALDSAGNIASTRFVHQNSSADYYDIVNSQLHMGKYGGRPVKLVYGLLGITSAVLSISGFVLWLKRKRRKQLITAPAFGNLV